MKCEYCDSIIPDGSAKCPLCGAVLSQTDVSYGAGSLMSDPAVTEAMQNDINRGYHMKWHNFLVHFALWFGAVSNMLSGIRYLTGIGLENTAGSISRGPVYGAVVFAFGVINFLLAFRMLRRKKGAPMQYILVSAASLVAGVVYSVLSFNKDAEALAQTGLGPQFLIITLTVVYALCAVRLIAELIYYKKRDHLFVN